MALPPHAEPATADVLVPVPYALAERHQETHDTWTLTLEPAGDALAAFAPGQFAMLYAFGAGEVPISISGEVSSGGMLVHTVRAVGSVTRVLCALEPGAYVGARGPFGTPWSIAAAEGQDVLVVAGGIGLAPLRPLIQHVIANRERFGRLIIAYGGRAPQELLYVEELERWRERFDAHVGVTVDSAGPEWRGHVGVVTTLLNRAELHAANARAFVCGPEVMMRFTLAALRETGLPPASVELSLERSMKCAIGHCGRCQLRERFICKDGPVFGSEQIAPLMMVREL